MADFTITNLSSDEQHIGDWYAVTLAPAGETGDAVTLEGRSPSELATATRLQELLDDGKVSLSVSYTAAEVGGGLMLPPEGVLNGEFAFGDLEAADFSSPAQAVHIPGCDGPGLRMGDNGLSAPVKGDGYEWIFLPQGDSEQFRQAGNLHLIFLSSGTESSAALSLVGNGTARASIMLDDGALVCGTEGEVYRPGRTVKIEVRNSAARRFAVTATGDIQTSQTQTPTGSTPGGDADAALPIYDETGSIIGYIPIHNTLW